MRTKYTVRPYGAQYFDRLCEIHDCARMDELRHSNLEDAFLPLIETAKNENLFDYSIAVAEHAGRIDGFIAYTSHELAWLYVWPRAYRRGIATLLTRYVINKAASKISVEVLEGNDPAYRFYLAIGFRLIEKASGKMLGDETFNVTIYTMEFCSEQSRCNHKI